MRCANFCILVFTFYMKSQLFQSWDPHIFEGFLQKSKVGSRQNFVLFILFIYFMNAFVTHQCLVFNLLADEFVFTEGIAGLSCDGVYGSLFHLLFDGTEQHEERLASTLLSF